MTLIELNSFRDVTAESSSKFGLAAKWRGFVFRFKGGAERIG